MCSECSFSEAWVDGDAVNRNWEHRWAIGLGSDIYDSHKDTEDQSKIFSVGFPFVGWDRTHMS